MHNAQVVHLHSNTYSRPFTMPPAPALAPESARPVSEGASCVSSPGTTFSELASSEIGEISEVHSEELKLRDPSKLRSSQLTDATYRQYVLDYMTQETVTALTSAMRSDVSGSHAQRSYVPPVKNRQYSWNGLRQVLSLFPESFTAAGGETSKSAARNSSLLLDPFSVPPRHSASLAPRPTGRRSCDSTRGEATQAKAQRWSGQAGRSQSRGGPKAERPRLEVDRERAAISDAPSNDLGDTQPA